MTRSGRVLLIEDDDLVTEATETGLTLAGYDVVAVPSGIAALELFTSGGSFAQQPPDVILLDLLMPDMDGEAFLHAYRRRPGPHAPVIAFTALIDGTERAGRLNVAGVLLKPFSVEELLTAVGHFAGSGLSKAS
jgi:CheY-like chemotaxis protein